MPPVALLAGGKATRLFPLTETIAKAMVEVAGAPFIAHQLRLLKSQNITQVVICCGVFSEQIEAYVGDGSAFGLQVRYSPDGPTLLGTGGALKQALPLLGEQFFVLYGDSYLPTPFAPILEAFARAGKQALMTVYRNRGQWDTSNVAFVQGMMEAYDKVHRTAAMEYIDYGLGMFTAEAFSETQTVFDLATLYQSLLQAGQLAGHEVRERFYEIGSPAGLAEFAAWIGAAH